MESDSQKNQTFANATGQTITQLYTPLNYTIPGKIYEVRSSDRKHHHSLLYYVKQLMTYVLATKLKQLLSSITLKPKPTLQSTYSSQSLAILSNSFDLDHALTRARQYNIPLLQIVIMTEKGEETVKQKILLHFRVSHLINENFVLYGDWTPRPELFKAVEKQKIEQGEMPKQEGIYVRMGEYVYAFISMKKIEQSDDQTFEQNLIKVRNMFYQIEDHSQSTFSNLEPPGGSDFTATASMFGPQRSYRQGEREGYAFEDSDEEPNENAY